MSEWDLETEIDETITTKQLDDAAKLWKELEGTYDDAKALSTAAFKEYEKGEKQFQELLKKAGKKKYTVEGLGTISRVDKLGVTTPKTDEDKRAFFTWLKAKGNDVYFRYITINHASLNSFYNSELDAASESGEEFNVPGIGAPTSSEHLRFIKEKVK